MVNYEYSVYKSGDEFECFLEIIIMLDGKQHIELIFPKEVIQYFILFKNEYSLINIFTLIVKNYQSNFNYIKMYIIYHTLISL